MGFIVTIDGPNGAGKSTVAKRLAKILGFTHLDTGAIYRSVAWKAQQSGISTQDAPSLATIAGRLNIFWDTEGRLFLKDSENQPTDITEAIRTPEVSAAASKLATYPEVRQALLLFQRSFATSNSIVVEGRDTGTVVFPNAQAKFFLTASAEERARRRWAELTAKGVQTSFEQVLAESIARDKQDTERATAPLVQAPDAELVPTDSYSLDEVVSLLAQKVREKLNS